MDKKLHTFSTYVGVKVVFATTMDLGEYNEYRKWTIPENEDPKKEGYLVIYSNDYESWCPKDQFEEANRLIEGMPFGHALELLKKGKKVTRSGWNRKEFWIEAQFPDENSKMTMPYLYMVKFNQKFPTDLSCESIMAEDWMVVE